MCIYYTNVQSCVLHTQSECRDAYRRYLSGESTLVGPFSVCSKNWAYIYNHAASMLCGWKDVMVRYRFQKMPRQEPGSLKALVAGGVAGVIVSCNLRTPFWHSQSKYVSLTLKLVTCLATLSLQPQAIYTIPLTGDTEYPQWPIFISHSAYVIH